MYGDEVNTYFVFVVLRNLFVSSKKKMQYDSIEESTIEGSQEQHDFEAEIIYDDLINEIWDEVDSWHWYDSKLFKLYHNTDMTIKKISEETKISERSIWNTLDNGRKKIKHKRQKAYQAWKTSQKG